MPKKGRKYKNITEKRDTKTYNLLEAIKKVKKNSYTSFTSTIDLHLTLKPIKDKEPKSIKGAVSLPYSENKKTRIAAFTLPEEEQKAKDAGADLVGTEELMKDIKGGKIDFDVAIATPSIMSKIAQVGKELGPKGLMPNPKTGTVTEDIEKTIKEYKKGKLNFAADQHGVIHIAAGKIDMDDEKIKENIIEIFKAIELAVGKKEISQIVRIMHLAPTMGPSAIFEYSE